MEAKQSEKSILVILKNLILVARPVHWIKNISVFAALIFSGTLFIPSYFKTSLLAFISFSFISSSAYIFNDIIDKKRDQLHPFKRHRPIASGRIPINVALAESLFLSLCSLFIANKVNDIFLTLIVAYLILQVLYSLVLKNFAILDILIIAAGFILRIYGGAFAINAHLSVWFLLCVISVSLFLASGKRRAELNAEGNDKPKTRLSLSNYNKELLNSYVTMFGNAAWLSWSLFAFFESPKVSLPIWVILAEISKTITINKLLMTTIPIVIFAIMRYEKLIFDNKTERPEKLILTDIPLVTSVLIWGIMIIWIFYSGAAIWA
ncbi:MAG: decaprenyl-phosphate phosphoribosyltransferase [Patescibacteria group bacterium]|nr:MAG: decaprenyl-phosphate phosphoribosyltransferase [Patescibacteria group bacterium]